MRHWVGILVLASTVAIGEEPAERLPDVGDPGAETFEVAAESLPLAPRPIEDPSDDGRHESGEAAAKGTSGLGSFYSSSMTAAQLASTDAGQIAQGRQLVDLDVIEYAGLERFSGIWFPVSGTVYQLIQGTSSDWSAFISQMGPLAGRWLDVEVGYYAGTKRYSALFFENGDDYGYALHTTDTESGFQGHLESYRNSGRSLVDFEAYTLPSGETRFAGIWVNDPNQPITHLYYHLESADVSWLLDPLQGRVIDLERYYSSLHGEDRYAVVTAMVRGGGWGQYRNQTTTSLSSNNAAIVDGDTFMIDLDPVITSGGSLRYDAVWGDAGSSLQEIALMPGPIDAEPLDANLQALITQFETTLGVGTVGLYGKNLRTNQSLSYRGNELFYLASATKTAIHLRYWMQVAVGHLNATTTMAYTEATNTGADWYVDERTFPGFASGAPGRSNDLGQSFALDRFDRAMMSVSDNGATSALHSDSQFGLQRDALDLNEWLADQSGVGRGWGVVTNIQDTDRFIMWQGQQEDGRAADQSYFRAPGFTFGPRWRGQWDVCTVGGVLPVDCVSQNCTRCTPNVAVTGCSGSESCQELRDPWGELADFFGIANGQNAPFVNDDLGHDRFYNMNLNQATPRAVGNLWEGLAEERWVDSGAFPGVLNNMGEGTSLNNGATFPSGITTRAKGGTKRNVCTDTGMFQYRGETIVLNVLTKETTRACGSSNVTNDIRDIYMPAFGEAILRALGADYDVVDPATDSLGSPTTIRPDESFIYFANVNNVGGGDGAAVDVDFYLSTNTSITTSDTLIASRRSDAIPGRTNDTVLGNVPLPDLPRGTYWLGWRIDDGGELPELVEGDSGVYPTPITIQARLEPITDFRMSTKSDGAWSPIVDAASYWVYEGVSAALPSLATGDTESCRAQVLTAPEAIGTFGSTPPAGEFFWYLIAAENDGPLLPGSGGERLLDSTGTCGDSCAQPTCSTGAALDPACDTCAAQICAVDPYCCDTAWDANCVREVRTVCGSLTCDESAGSCAHPVCTTGVALTPGCDNPPLSDSCVTAVCNADSFCCGSSWDALCVGRVEQYCDAVCE